MAYCPECGAEFGGGIRRCPECRIDLLVELEDPNLYDSQVENLVLVRESASLEEAHRIKDHLTRNGILCVVESASGNKSARPASTNQVLVNSKDAGRSNELIRDLLG
ncbi:MAG: hypothetical protein U0V70_16475 [Terriglobia bacterium]